MDHELTTRRPDLSAAQRLLDALAEGVSVVDASGHPLLVNEAFCTMTGFGRDELLSDPPKDFRYWPPEHKEAILEAFEAMRSHHDRSFELVFARKGGDRFPCSVSTGTATVDGARCFIATVRDRSESTQRKARVEELARLVQMLMHAGDLSTWEWDMRTDTFRISESWYTQLGEPSGPTEVRTGSMAQRVHPDDIELGERELTRLLAGEVRIYEFEHRLRMASGDYRWFLARGFVTEEGPDGQPVRIGGTVQDVHRVKMQEERMQRWQQMEVLGLLTGGVAHDFNNLLAVIQGNLELMRWRDESDGDSGLDDMDAAVRRAKDLTSWLLRYARDDGSDAQRIDLGSLLAKTREILRAATASHATLSLSVTIPDEPHITNVDPTPVEHALLNLVINARHAVASAERPEVEVRVGRQGVATDRARRLGCATGDYVTLSVCDNGVGMSDEVQRRATEPLFTTRGHGEGTGYGLSMAKRCATRAAGFLDIRSAPGEGTTVTLGFPAEDATATVDTPYPEPTAKPPPRADGVLLLVVDDEPAILRSLSSALQARGYQVHTTRQPRAALQWLQEHEVDLVLTDVMLRDALDGVGLAHLLRVHRPGLPLVFMTGAIAEEIDPDARRMGPVIAKPFDIDDLHRTLLSALQPAS